jgi:hypothetical protein
MAIPVKARLLSLCVRVGLTARIGIATAVERPPARDITNHRQTASIAVGAIVDAIEPDTVAVDPVRRQSAENR